MKRKLVADIARAVRAKVGYPVSLIEAYEIGKYSNDPDEDCNAGADHKESLKLLNITLPCKLDCYLYSRQYDSGDIELAENVEVSLDENGKVLYVRNTAEVIREELRAEFNF